MIAGSESNHFEETIAIWEMVSTQFTFSQKVQDFVAYAYFMVGIENFMNNRILKGAEQFFEVQKLRSGDLASAYYLIKVDPENYILYQDMLNSPIYFSDRTI